MNAEDLTTLFSFSTCFQVRSIMNVYNTVLQATPNRMAPSQMMLFSSHWTPGIYSFHNKCMQSPAVIITSSYEAAIYGGVTEVRHFSSQFMVV
jgi:hypothetical protein